MRTRQQPPPPGLHSGKGIYVRGTQQQFDKLIEGIAAGGTTAIIRRPGREMSHRVAHQTYPLAAFPFHEFEICQLALALDTRTSGSNTIGVVDAQFRQWELQFVQGMTSVELGALKALLTGEGVSEAGRQEGLACRWHWYPVQDFPYEEYERHVLQEFALSVISENIRCPEIALRPRVCMHDVQASGPFAGVSNNTFELPEIIDDDVGKEFSRPLPDEVDLPYRYNRLCLLLHLTTVTTPKAF